MRCRYEVVFFSRYIWVECTCLIMYVLYAISSSFCLLNSVKIKLFEKTLYNQFDFSNSYKMSSGASALSGVKPKIEAKFWIPVRDPRWPFFLKNSHFKNIIFFACVSSPNSNFWPPNFLYKIKTGQRYFSQNNKLYKLVRPSIISGGKNALGAAGQSPDTFICFPLYGCTGLGPAVGCLAHLLRLVRVDGNRASEGAETRWPPPSGCKTLSKSFPVYFCTPYSVYLLYIGFYDQR